MDIRLACASDIPGMIRLLYQVGQVHYRLRPDLFRPGALKYTPEELAQILEDESRPVFVAAEESRVLGYCFCIRREYRDNGVFTQRQELYIDDLCVEEEFRGQGIARALYGHVCDWARELGCGFVTLNVWCGNEGAEAFYGHMGMTPRNVTMEMKLC